MTMVRSRDWWWDRTWNPFGGCSHVSPGCQHCYAQLAAGTWLKSSATHERLLTYTGTTTRVKGRPVFNGRLTLAPLGHRLWTWPLEWIGSQEPVLGAGKPSLIFVGDMADLFHERRPAEVIDRVTSTIAASEHIGLLLTKRPRRMDAYFRRIERSRSPDALRRWRTRLWLGFSAERQKEFDERWPCVRPLAARGWIVFCSIAPMLGAVRLPQDFLNYRQRAWAICSGEQGPNARDMDPSWPRAVLDQCVKAGVPFFMKQVASQGAIRPDLLVRQFPRVGT